MTDSALSSFERMRAYAEVQGVKLTAVARNLISRSLPYGEVLEAAALDGWISAG